MSDQPAKPDVELAQALVLKGGYSHAEICAATGMSKAALAKRITRSWGALRDRLAVAGAEKKMSLAERSQLVRESLAADLEATAAELPNVKRSTHPALAKERQELVASVATTSAKVFNWDGENRSNVTNVFNLALLESAEFLPQNALVATVDAEIIETQNAQNSNSAPAHDDESERSTEAHGS